MDLLAKEGPGGWCRGRPMANEVWLWRQNSMGECEASGEGCWACRLGDDGLVGVAGVSGQRLQLTQREGAPAALFGDVDPGD